MTGTIIAYLATLNIFAAGKTNKVTFCTLHFHSNMRVICCVKEYSKVQNEGFSMTLTNLSHGPELKLGDLLMSITFGEMSF